MKLKLNTQGAAAAPQPPTPGVPQTPGGSILKLKFSRTSEGEPTVPSSAATAAVTALAADLPRQKRKYTRREKGPDGQPLKVSKKRKGSLDDTNTPPAKKAAKRSSRHSLGKNALPPTSGAPPGPQRSLSIKISTKPKSNAQKILSRISLKNRGKPPVRPLGVGYDSEASDAEEDPAIESQFVMRLWDQKDADDLRRAIEERKIGEKEDQGGVRISIHWFEKEARRAMVQINNTKYAAVMVDLPTVTESMKSWDRKGFYKSADICQILILLGKVDNEEQAKVSPLPREVDPKTFQYPHGLTPPMHWVRKRRFRKRISYHSIEAMERQVESLLAKDETAMAAGGSTSYEVLDPEKARAESSSEESDEDAEGEMVDEDMDAIGEAAPVDDEMMQLMEEFEQEGDEGGAAGSAVITDPATGTSVNATVHVHTTSVSADAATVIPTTETTPSASGGAVTTTSSEAATSEDEPSAGTSEDDDEDDDDDDGAGGEDGEEDEVAFADAQAKAELREEVADLEREVAAARATAEMQKNPLLRQRAYQSLQGLEQDLAVKKASLGIEDDE